MQARTRRRSAAARALAVPHPCGGTCPYDYVMPAPLRCLIALPDAPPAALQLIERIAALPCPKAVILGNHDAW